MEGQGGSVLYILNSQDIPLSVLERILLGTQAQHGPVYGPGVTLSRRLDGALTLPWLANMTPLIRPHKALTREDAIFAELLQAFCKTPQTKTRIYQWISNDTWCIIDTRIALRRDPT